MKRTTKYLNIYKRLDGKLIPGGIIHPTRKRAKECSIDGSFRAKHLIDTDNIEFVHNAEGGKE